MVLFRDITEKLHSEAEELRARQPESLGLLAGGIAHDFNNFLTAIQGNVSLAQAQAGYDPRIQEPLERALQSTRRAHGVSSRLLTFAKGGEPARTVMELPAVIQEATTDSPCRAAGSIAGTTSSLIWPGSKVMPPDFPGIPEDLRSMQTRPWGARDPCGSRRPTCCSTMGRSQASMQDPMCLSVSWTPVPRNSGGDPRPDLRAVFHHQVRRQRPRSGQRVPDREGPRRQYFCRRCVDTGGACFTMYFPASGRAFPAAPESVEVEGPGRGNGSWSWMTIRSSRRSARGS